MAFSRTPHFARVEELRRQGNTAVGSIRRYICDASTFGACGNIGGGNARLAIALPRSDGKHVRPVVSHSPRRPMARDLYKYIGVAAQGSEIRVSAQCAALEPEIRDAVRGEGKPESRLETYMSSILIVILADYRRLPPITYGRSIPPFVIEAATKTAYGLLRYPVRIPYWRAGISYRSFAECMVL